MVKVTEAPAFTPINIQLETQEEVNILQEFLLALRIEHDTMHNKGCKLIEFINDNLASTLYTPEANRSGDVYFHGKAIVKSLK